MLEVRRRIMQAALELFSKHGYIGATTKEIASAANITEVTLFRHFASKEKLFEETVTAHLPSPDFYVLIVTAYDLPYRKALELITHAFLEGLRSHESLIRIMYAESQRHFELMERVYVALIDNLTSLLADYFLELQKRGVIRQFHPTRGARAFLGMWTALYEGEFLMPTSAPANTDFSEIIREYIDIFISGTQNTNQAD